MRVKQTLGGSPCLAGKDTGPASRESKERAALMHPEEGGRKAEGIVSSLRGHRIEVAPQVRAGRGGGGGVGWSH